MRKSKKRKQPAVKIDHGYEKVEQEPTPLTQINQRRVSLGDIVARIPITLFSRQEEERMLRGKVVYIHPLERYHVVEFAFSNGDSIRESFLGVET